VGKTYVPMLRHRDLNALAVVKSTVCGHPHQNNPKLRMRSFAKPLPTARAIWHHPIRLIAIYDGAKNAAPIRLNDAHLPEAADKLKHPMNIQVCPMHKG
jgi:hypothetical protein